MFQEALAQVEPQSESTSRPQVDPSELVPRLCHLVRSETGYGFNLHSDRSRPGQYIRSLDPGSPADRAGLRPQDRLIEVGLHVYSTSSEADTAPFMYEDIFFRKVSVHTIAV